MQRYFEFIVRRRWLVLIVSLGIAAAGFYNLLNLAIDAVPDISPKQVMILTEVSGMAAPEVERLATFPVENAMAGIPGLKSIRSISRFGISAVYVTFHDTVEETTARQYVFQRLQQAKQMMAPGVGEPNMGPMATGLGEIYQFQLRGPGYTPMQLWQMMQWTIAPQLRLTPGIVDVNIYGGEMPTYEVRIGTEALLRYGISVSQVFNAIANNNAAKGGAYIERNDQQEVIRGEGFAESPRDITSIVLTTGPDGTPITIGTLGEVVEAPKVRIGAVSHDGKGETVVGIALMHYGQNASQVIEAVKQSVARI